MDFDQLETFIEVARLSSFSRAAEKRFRTQPAISSQIRSLEEEVGAKLLDRSGGKVSITASGKLFLKFAEDTLDARKAAMTTIAETERVPRGRNCRGRQRRHLPAHPSRSVCEFQEAVSRRFGSTSSARTMRRCWNRSSTTRWTSAWFRLPVTDTRLTAVSDSSRRTGDDCAAATSAGEVQIGGCGRYCPVSAGDAEGRPHPRRPRRSVS